MSAYIKSPFRPPTPLLVANSPQYVLGSWSDKTGPTVGNVISDSAASTTATVTIQILGGNVPKVGALITIVGAANNAVFNVTNSPITAVSAAATPDAGIYQVQFAISSTTQVATSDAGSFIIPQAEIGEDITGMGSTYASVSVSAPFNNPQVDQGKALSVVVSSPALHAGSAFTVALQGSLFDIDSEFQDIATVAAVAAGSYGTTGHFNSGQGTAGTPGEVNLLNYRFYRLNISSASGLGTAGQTTVVGKIEC